MRLPQNVIDNFKKIEEIVEKEAKNKEYDKKYALVDKVKKGQQELAFMFISFLKTSMPSLSKQLENKSHDEVYHELDRHFKKEVNKLLRYVQIEEDIAVSLSEAIYAIIEATVDGDASMDNVVKKIKEIK